MPKKKTPPTKPIPVDVDHVYVNGAFWHRFSPNADGTPSDWWWKSQGAYSTDAKLRALGPVHVVIVGDEI